MNLFSCLSIYPAIHPSNHPPSHPSIQPAIHPAIHPATHPSNHPPSQPDTHPSLTDLFHSHSCKCHPYTHDVPSCTSNPDDSSHFQIYQSNSPLDSSTWMSKGHRKLHMFKTKLIFFSFSKCKCAGLPLFLYFLSQFTISPLMWSFKSASWGHPGFLPLLHPSHPAHH